MATSSFMLSAKVDDSKTTTLARYTGGFSSSAESTLDASALTKVYMVSGSGAGPDTYDVNSGLTNAYGVALVYTTVKGIWIKNTHATATLVIGGGSNPLLGTDQYTLKAGNALAITSPFTVDGTHKVLKITQSATATYELVILGS